MEVHTEDDLYKHSTRFDDQWSLPLLSVISFSDGYCHYYDKKTMRKSREARIAVRNSFCRVKEGSNWVSYHPVRVSSFSMATCVLHFEIHIAKVMLLQMYILCIDLLAFPSISTSVWRPSLNVDISHFVSLKQISNVNVASSSSLGNRLRRRNIHVA